MENQYDTDHVRIGAAWIKETRRKLAEGTKFRELLDNRRRLTWFAEEMLVQKRQCSVRDFSGGDFHLVTVEAADA